MTVLFGASKTINLTRAAVKCISRDLKRQDIPPVSKLMLKNAK